MEPGNIRVAEAFAVLAEKAGIYGMVGGQTVDVETDKGVPITREKLDFIYALKTGALIEAAMLVGAILAGADKKEQKIIESAAGAVGLAFQIQDDILDVTGTMEVLGKPSLPILLLALQQYTRRFCFRSSLYICHISYIELDEYGQP